MGRGTGFFGNPHGTKGGCGIQAFAALTIVAAIIIWGVL